MATSVMVTLAPIITLPVATDGRGYYIFNGLHPGTYNLKAEMAGFRAEEMQNVVLAVSQRTNIELTLNVAGLEQQMTIVEAAPTLAKLETGGSAIGTTVAGQYTRDMPLYGRSYFGLVFLSGGITESAGSGMRDNGCECPVAKDSKYCSPDCESVGDRPSIACECGHAECNAGGTVGEAG